MQAFCLIQLKQQYGSVRLVTCSGYALLLSFNHHIPILVHPHMNALVMISCWYTIMQLIQKEFSVNLQRDACAKLPAHPNTQPSDFAAKMNKTVAAMFQWKRSVIIKKHNLSV